MFRVLLWVVGATLLVGGIGYAAYNLLTHYGDDPFMLMVLAVPIVAALGYLLQVMRR